MLLARDIRSPHCSALFLRLHVLALFDQFSPLFCHALSDPLRYKSLLFVALLALSLFLRSLSLFASYFLLFLALF